MRLKKCKICKKEFRAFGSQNLCSFDCAKINKSNHDKKYRIKNEEKLKNKKKEYYYSGGKKRLCTVCKKEFFKASPATHCSRKCYFEAQKESRIGKRNPNWKNGTHSNTYNKNYQNYVYKTQGKTLEELGCEVCFIKNGVIFDRHHIVFKSEKPRHPEINNPLNIIQVCRSCHLLLHGKKSRRNEIVEKRGLEGLFKCRLIC